MNSPGWFTILGVIEFVFICIILLVVTGVLH